MKRFVISRALGRTLALAAFLATASRAEAHCDRLDGPVVQAAQRALATGNIGDVLIWVDVKDEAEVSAAFKHVLEVRKLGVEAKDLADRYFFETVIRVHRAGEGAPYVGLKSGKEELPLPILLADQAVESGEIDAVADFLTKKAAHAVKSRFAALQAKKSYEHNDIAAGRAFVRAYVDFIHTVERIHSAADATEGSSHGDASADKVQTAKEVTHTHH